MTAKLRLPTLTDDEGEIRRQRDEPRHQEGPVMLNTRRQGQVAILTIDRSNRRNALGSELIHALATALVELQDDSGAAAIVISGTAPGFCAGSDLKELAAMTVPQMCHYEAETARIARLIGFIEKPVVAAVSGFALGGGIGLAAACDLIVTHAECRWHMPEVPSGWLPPWGLEAISQRMGPVAAHAASTSGAIFSKEWSSLRQGCSTRCLSCGMSYSSKEEFAALHRYPRMFKPRMFKRFSTTTTSDDWHHLAVHVEKR
ncbi:enoyl-CoA hydratase/isomerase family protein [Bradyrhizobium genosp. P]|uniref:enoyl-CoA hydratase/isomerase family protein n=1 Tax=Bradyrhizobium genosp. P TaxID=83641 RepID=UPI003CF36152